MTETYDKLMMSWLKKLEKKETNPTKKTKDAKLREYFEKQFPELRKQREDRERFSRVGQRIRSDAELEEIMDGIQEQELEDKKMRSYAVIPPILLDSRLKKYRFMNKNGLIEDCLTEYKEKQMLNVWTNQEKEIFREKFLQHPKNFGLIASYLERKTIAECVQYYYLSKKSENYKQLLRKHVKKRTRALVKAQQQQQQQAAQVNSKQNQEEQKFTSKVLSSNNTTTTTTASTTTSSIVTTASVISSSSTTTTTSAFSEVNCKTNTEKFVKTVPNNDNNLNMNLIDENVPHKCCVCGEKVENSSKSKPVTLTNYQLYGLTNDNVKLGMRVCLMCHFKTVRRDCPIESCKTPRRKVKKLKLLPPQWFDLSSDQKMFFANDLNIPIDTKIACQRCVMRIARKLGAISFLKNNNIQYVNSEIKWDENEIESIKKGIKEYGKDWNAIATLVNTKTIKECKEFYFNYKYVYDLDQFLREFKINNGDLVKSDESDSDEFWNEISDADSEETSSAEEGNERCTSDTASASSPMNKTEEKDFDLAKGVTEKSLNNSPNCKLQDYKVLSTSQGSLKSDYDSSATMSADEGQGNCENEGRISPSPSSMHLPPRANSAMPVFPPSNNTIYQHQQSEKNARPASHDAAFALDMVGKVTHSTPILQGQKVPPFLINPNAPQPVSVSHINNNKEEPTCVRDLIYQAIELSLQSPAKGGRGSSVLGGDNDKHSNPDSDLFTLPGIKREDLIDGRKQSTSHDISHPFKNSELPRPEGLAMVASFHPHQIMTPHSYNVDGDYEVQDLSKKDKRTDDSSGRSYSVSQIKDKMGFIRNEQYSFVPPPAHSNQYRPNEKESKEMFSYPRQENKYMKVGYGYSERIGSRTPDLSQSDKNPTSSSFNRVTSKIPSTKSSAVPPPPPLIASGKASQMSPNLAYRDKLVPVSTTGGSITHGTPIVPQQYGQGLLRQLPSLPPKESSGSITLGTPLISGANESTKRKSDINDNSRGEVVRPLQHMMYEHGMKQFYRGSSPTQSPYSAQFQHQGVYQPNLQAHIANQSNRTPFHKESQLSSNQLMIDFNTSKQMLTRRGSGSSEKDNRSSTPTQDARLNPIDSKVITPSRHPLCVNYSPTAPGIPHSIYSERFQQSEAASSFINDKKQDSHLSPTNYHWSKQNPNLPVS